MTNTHFTHTPSSWEDVFNIRTRLSEFITGHRLAHTLSVEKEALDMAKILFPRLGISEEYYSDVCSAALLHDITKHFSLEEHLELCKKYSLDITHDYEKSSAILHSVTGAFLAKELFDVNDVIFRAIRFHTIGSCDMDIIAKIIFLADYIEPTRTVDSLKLVRDSFYSAISDKNNDAMVVLNDCILSSIDNTLFYLIQKKSLIHIQTVITHNCILAENALLKSVEGTQI